MSLDQRSLATIARDLLERPDPATAGLWPRAAALLTRQALEAALDDLWRSKAPGVERASGHAQLLCLPRYLGDDGLAGRVSYAWIGLSRACHHHAYELPPASSEIANWVGIVEELIRKVATLQARAPGAGV